MITKEQAFKLKPGDILVDEFNKRWKVNGLVKTWKRNPERIYVPLKHGLYSFDYLTETNFDGEGKCSLLTLWSSYAGV